jgi:hypothetical protein
VLNLFVPLGMEVLIGIRARGVCFQQPFFPFFVKKNELNNSQICCNKQLTFQFIKN